MKNGLKFNVAMAESGLMHFPAKEASREGLVVQIHLATLILGAVP